MSYNIKPTTHFIFREIFGVYEMRNSLISLLNSILDIDNISSVEILNTGAELGYSSNKLNNLYILAKTTFNQKINIVINLRNEYDIVNKSLYYLSKMYCNQFELNNKYFNLNKTIYINILNCNTSENKICKNKYHCAFSLKEKESNYELTDVLEMHFIELNKVDINKPIENMLDAWTCFLINPFSTNLENILNVEKDNYLNLAFLKYKELIDDESIKERYALYREAELDENSRLNAHDINKIKQLYSKGVSLDLIKSIYKDFSEGDINKILK